MSGNIGTIALTLSPAAPAVHLTGTLDAYGTAGLYAGARFYAAVIGPAGSDFLVRNSGVVESVGTSATDAGIVLGSAGTVVNDGGLRAGAGVAIFGAAGGEVRNKGEILATLGVGVYLQGAGTAENTGLVTAQVDGIVLAGGGYALNTGRVEAAAGILLGGGPGGYVYNTGVVKSRKRDGISLSADGYVYNTGHIKAAHAGIVLAGGGMAYNAGIILASKDGIFSAGGAVYNYAKGTITGAPFGVYLAGAGYVYNAGSINGEANSRGKAGAAVSVAGGGYVYNAAGGRLTGPSGVVATGGALTMVNEGFIYGSGSNAAGVYAAMGGTVVNDGTIAGDAGLSPGVGGIVIAGAAGTVTNAGVMTGYFNGAAIVLRDGGVVDNSGVVSGIYASGVATVTNTGTVIDVTLAGGGLVSNEKSMGAVILDAPGTVFNGGQVGAGIDLLQGGTVINTGDIYGRSYDGIMSTASLYILNENFVGAVDDAIVAGAAGTVVNDGQVVGVPALGEGENSEGIQSAGAEVVNNGSVYGLSYGIRMTHGGTIFDAGTVQSRADAVYFKSGYDNLLVLAPGARFLGSVVGGGGALEFAAGSAAGTIDLGASFSGFVGITIDPGATWAFAGGTTLAGSLAVDNDGTIFGVGAAGLSIAGAVSGGGTIDAGGGGLTLDGSVAAGQHVAFTTKGETVFLGDITGFAGTIENFAAGETIDLTGVAPNLVTGISFANGVLTVREAFSSYQLTFANPGSFAHEKFRFFRDHGETGITLSPRSASALLAPAVTLQG